MTPEDLKACQQIAQNLSSKKYKDKNYMFLAPFDLSQTPGYMDVVEKVMDLSTLLKNVTNNAYATKDDFFQDAATVFDNAIAYHSPRETTWIAKLAKDMLKILARERKAAEKKSEKKAAGSSISFLSKKRSSDGNAKLKIRLGASGSAGGRSTPTPGTASGKSSPVPPAASSASSKPAPPSGKPKLTLKLKPISKPSGSGAGGATASSGGSGANASKSDEPKPKKRKLTIKMSKSKTSGSTSASSASASKPSAPATKSNAKSSSSSSSAAASSSSPKPSSSSSPKISLKASNPSRGKELPKGVVAAASTASTSKSSSPKTSSSSGATTKGKKSSSALPTIKIRGSSSSATTTKSKVDSATTKKTTTKKTKAARESTTKKSTTKKTGTKKSSGSSSGSSSINRGMMSMTPQRKAQCAKVLSGIKRRKQSIMWWFSHPVSDKNIVQDYRNKIPFPMDLSSMQSKLEKNQYATIAQFALDLRRIFSNCLRFNTDVKEQLRGIAKEGLVASEELMIYFLAKPEQPSTVYPPLLYCWNQCLLVLDELLSLTNPEDSHQTALYFLFPVSFYCGGQFPPDYLDKVAKPMDFGTVTANLVEGNYTNVDAFAADCNLVLENCNTYYGGRQDGKMFVDQANRLKARLQTRIKSLKSDLDSKFGEELRARAASAIKSSSLPQPPPVLLLSVLTDLRSTKYTDKATKITEPATAPFEHPVSIVAFPDYNKFVTIPMDLQTVERKIKAGLYATPEDFESEVMLVFNNAIAYNTSRKSDHLVAMAKYGLKHFRKIFAARILSFDDPAAAAKESTSKDAQRRSSLSSVTSQGPTKKMKLESSSISSKSKTTNKSSTKSSSKSTVKGTNKSSTKGSTKNTAKSTTKGTTKSTTKATSKNTSKATSKNTPRISLSMSSNAPPAPPTQSKPKTKVSSNRAKLPPPSTNQPVPLHIAIARVKEGFPVRRNVKTLESWEAICSRFFKDMMRHPWISAARPKFIFHVPVPALFPEVRDAYAVKIRKPMDLTTVECKLLAGGWYKSPEDFISDVALIFSNAIAFNKDGRDAGDPLSCAYYDASVHLLRYSRWLSMEHFSQYLEDTDHCDEDDTATKLPPSMWRFTTGNRAKARQEMSAIVLNEPLEKSLEGDRYTWMESECEKLLKALRHQSDLRHMTFFIQANYPADYTAFISKPMDWEKVQKTLKKRQYNNFRGIIDDLRLIFTNALKYNASHEGADTVSGRAFDAAKFMSAKLETAINKVMLSVSDRLERERIDHNNAEREIEAAERAEEERIRAQWKSENKDSAGMDGSKHPERSQNVRSHKRSAFRRASDADFEVPFFDEEDDGHHERSYVETGREQKAMFERQRQDLQKMRAVSSSVGASVFLRHQKTQQAEKWLEEELRKLTAKAQDDLKATGGETGGVGGESKVLEKIEDPNRPALQIKLLPIATKKAATASKSKDTDKKKKKKKRKRAVNAFELD